MKILMANKFWYLKGGAERYMFELIRLLVRHGHCAVPFAMRHSKNQPSSYERFFVSEVETRDPGRGWQAIRLAGRMTWSFEAAHKFQALLAREHPDIVHAQNIYQQISPSILRVAAARHVPVVMTLHDYHLVSPNYGMFTRGAPARPSRKHPYRDTVSRRLVRDSISASALSAFKSWLHEKMRVYDHVYRFIAPSRFMRDTMLEYGWPEEKIVHVPHFIDLKEWRPEPRSEDRVVFVGRLSSEKGVVTLIEAMKEVPHLKASIVGDGPDMARLRLVAKKLGLTNVEFKGALYGDNLKKEMTRARAVIVPSLSFEVFGLTVLEAYALGKPVIASDVGGLPEVVRVGETGFLFAPGHHEDLADRLKKLTPEKARMMGMMGRKLVERDYGPEEHYQRIMKIYRSAR